MSGNRLSLWSGSRGRNGFVIRPVELVAILSVGILASFLLSSPAFGDPPSRGQPGSSQPIQPGQSPQYLPDLTASITLKAEYPRKVGDVTCYSIRPIYTITNQGKKVSQSCWWAAARSEGVTPNVWQWYYGSMIPKLGAGRSFTVDMGYTLPWCPNDPNPPGYRVKVDIYNSVTESNENNNTVEKRYHPLPQGRR
jgi:hypothetical protein